MKKDDTVKLLSKDVYCYMKGHYIKVGTPGRVLGTRYLPEDAEPQVLVKFKGFSWPDLLNQSDVEVVK